MSHGVKLLLTIIINRIRSKLRPEIAEEQFSFMAEKGTRNTIFVLRMICGRAIEHQQVVFICFIDLMSKLLIKFGTKSYFTCSQNLHVDGERYKIRPKFVLEPGGCRTC